MTQSLPNGSLGEADSPSAEHSPDVVFLWQEEPSGRAPPTRLTRGASRAGRQAPSGSGARRVAKAAAAARKTPPPAWAGPSGPRVPGSPGAELLEPDKQPLRQQPASN
ncbi:hypothetical protein VULLAG_LOCUS13606 [Vulpes lagopus]